MRFRLIDAVLLSLLSRCSCWLQLTKVPDGEYLLQNAANSVLGKQLISLCKKRGIKTINMVRYVDEQALGVPIACAEECCSPRFSSCPCRPHGL